ncbi:hypothetical protein ACLOJK_008205 [Asimina triloba]
MIRLEIMDLSSTVALAMAEVVQEPSLIGLMNKLVDKIHGMRLDMKGFLEEQAKVGKRKRSIEQGSDEL